MQDLNQFLQDFEKQLYECNQQNQEENQVQSIKQPLELKQSELSQELSQGEDLGTSTQSVQKQFDCLKILLKKGNSNQVNSQITKELQSLETKILQMESQITESQQKLQERDNEFVYLNQKLQQNEQTILEMADQSQKLQEDNQKLVSLINYLISQKLQNLLKSFSSAISQDPSKSQENLQKELQLDTKQKQQLDPQNDNNQLTIQLQPESGLDKINTLLNSIPVEYQEIITKYKICQQNADFNLLLNPRVSNIRISKRMVQNQGTVGQINLNKSQFNLFNGNFDSSQNLGSAGKRDNNYIEPRNTLNSKFSNILETSQIRSSQFLLQNRDNKFIMQQDTINIFKKKIVQSLIEKDRKTTVQAKTQTQISNLNPTNQENLQDQETINQGTQQYIYSDYIYLLQFCNSHQSKKKCTLLILQNSLYLFDFGKKMKIIKELPLNKIQSITIVQSYLNYLVIHTETNDYLFETFRRTQFILYLQNIFQLNKWKQLPINPRKEIVFNQQNQEKQVNLNKELQVKMLSNYQGAIKVGYISVYRPNFFKKIIFLDEWVEQFCVLTNIGIQILDYQPKVNIFSESNYYGLLSSSAQINPTEIQVHNKFVIKITTQNKKTIHLYIALPSKILQQEWFKAIQNVIQENKNLFNIDQKQQHQN